MQSKRGREDLKSPFDWSSSAHSFALCQDHFVSLAIWVLSPLTHLSLLPGSFLKNLEVLDWSNNIVGRMFVSG